MVSEVEQKDEHQSTESGNGNRIENKWSKDAMVEDVGAWLIAFGTFIVYVATWGFLSTYGSYQIYYEATLLPNTPSSYLSWIGTIEAVLLIVFGVITGPIYDQGYIRELLYTGTFLTVFGVMMLSLCKEFYQVMLSQGWCIGIGSGVLFTPCIALVASRFQRNRAFAICFATCGTAVGGIIYPIVLERLLPRIGFSWATRILGFVTLAELLVALALILPNLKNDADNGSLRSLFEWAALKEPAFVAYCLALFFMWIAYWVPFFQIPAFAQYTLGSSTYRAFYVLVITNASTIVGRLLGVVVSVKLGVSEGLLGFSFIASLLLFVWMAVDTIEAYYAWCVLLGVFLAPLAVFVPALLPQVCPDRNRVGTRMGMAWAFASAGIIVGTPSSAALIDLESGNFKRMQILLGTCMLAGACCQLFVHICLRRQTKGN